MPGKIKVKILAGRNLPVMDRSGDTTDAYVEIKFGNTTYKTDVCRKTLNPQWNTEWYRFEVDDAELQDEPLQIRLMDHDTYSANDAIGKVYLNLNPLLLPGLPLTIKNIWTLEANMNSSTGAQGGSVMTGWIPVFDTMHGIRGEVNIIVKVELFSDFNKFRQSSCGVQFFYSPNVPHGYHAQVIHGFVEELIVSDDPEYKWIDKIRTPRASNEARQTLFFKISGEVQRKIGLKAMDLGGNAVIGYVQNFDLEGESGIVARGIGTAVTLIKLQDMSTSLVETSTNIEDLACYSLQSKHQLECSESDDSLPLLSCSPNHSPILHSSTNIHKTQMGNRFPKTERLQTRSRSVRVAEYHASSLKRQVSLQSSPSNIKKTGMSSLSLSDDLITESPLKMMLALEDMRGERTSVFTRGLKNLKYLPKRVIQMKSKFSDSFDDESDQDSTYSSSWSIVGSDSTKSSIPDLRQIRRKKFTHKKNSSESGVALLIRSVHAGFPLDSVREDRETPTPSPVNLLNSRGEAELPLKLLQNDNDLISNNNKHKIIKINKHKNDDNNAAEADKIPEEPEIEEEEEKQKNDKMEIKNEIFIVSEEKGFESINYDNNINIPMISSSETDTSTSEDDEPSESSTNYNILDDSLTTIESSEDKNENIQNNKLPSLILKENLEEVKGRIEKIEEKISEAEQINLSLDLMDIHENMNFINTSKIVSDEFHKKFMPEGLILDYDKSHNEIFTPLLPSAPSSPEEEQISSEYSLLSNLTEEINKSNDPKKPNDVDEPEKLLLKLSSSIKLKFLGKQASIDQSDEFSFPVMNSTPVEEKGVLLLASEFETILPVPDYFASAEPYMEPLFKPLIDFNSDSEQSDSILRVKLEEKEEDTLNKTILVDFVDEKNALINEVENNGKDNNQLQSDVLYPVIISNESENGKEIKQKLKENIPSEVPTITGFGNDKIIEENSKNDFLAQEITFINLKKDTEIKSESSDVKNDSEMEKKCKEIFSIQEKSFNDCKKNEKIENQVEKNILDPKSTVISLNNDEKIEDPRKNHILNERGMNINQKNAAEIKIEAEKTDIHKEISKKIVLNEKSSNKVMEEEKNQIKQSKHEFKKCINQPEILTTHEPSVPYKKYLFHSGSLESSKSSTERKEKTSKKITRTETVIYRGPLKKQNALQSIDHKDDKFFKSIQLTPRPSNNSPPAPVIVVAPPAEPECFLRVPMADTKDINVHSPHPKGSSPPPAFENPPTQQVFMDPQLISERFQRTYRQHCMLDLIKTIDTKLMVHSPHNRKDSTRSKKRRRDKSIISTTPSPDSIRKIRQHRKNSRSKSPEKHHHHHHHHHHHSHQNFSRSASHSSIPPVSSSTSLSLKKNASFCDIPLENLPKNNPCCLTDPQPSCLKEKLIPTAIIEDLNESKDREIAVKKLAVNNNIEINNKIEANDNSIAMDVIKPLINAENLLNPTEVDPAVHKSHSDSSLGILKNHLQSTKITNIANLNDPCVPCPPFCPRQQNDQPTSPVHPASALPTSVGTKVTNSPASKVPLHRRSSDSDLSITPKGNSLAGSDRSMGTHLKPSTAIVRTMNQDALEMLEYPFITIQHYPPGFVLNLGGLVSARSVKLIERISNLEEPESRDAWWTEIRMEVRSHARALGCNVVLGYKEEISICDDVCVLNASGTAAVINLLNTNQDQDVLLNKNQQAAIISSTEAEKTQQKSITNKNSNEKYEVPTSGQINMPTGKVKRISESNDHEIPNIPFNNLCNLCHLPYNEASVPFKVDVSKCAICKRAKVPDVLFTTIELPDNIPITGRGVFIQATVCKCKRDLRGELNAKEISDCLPFLEYELHSLLLNKLKVKGMNAIFGLKVQISIGERLIVGMAVGTAVFLTALPSPSIPQIASGNSWHKEDQLAEMQKALIETVKKNRELYRLKPIAEIENGRSLATSDTDESDDDLPDLDLGLGTKDACILEVDDVEDMDRINLLMDERPPEDFHVVNTQTIPGLEDLEIVRNLQMFTQIARTKIPAGQFSSMPSKYFARLLQTVFFKLRRMVPCALCDMQFKIALPEQDEIQLSVVGMALGLGEPSKISKYKRKGINNSTSRDLLKKTDDNDLIFNLDEDQAENSCVLETINQSHTSIPNSSPVASQTQKSRPRSPFKIKSHGQHKPKHVPLKERYGVDITPLSYLPGGRIERYLGNLNFFFIRESTSIRENGGLSGFTHSFITEILAIVRAHITALGGNAMVAFFMTQCVLLHSPHKNQGQCLINVGGDVVSVSYFGGDKHNQNC